MARAPRTARTTAEAVSLPPEEAIAFFRAKVDTPTRAWTDLQRDAHVRAFSVAGATSEALLRDFRAAVDKALSQGTTAAEFRADFDAIVARHGWAHSGSAGFRASIIYETNLAVAYSAGRYAQMTEPATLAAFPYWTYMRTSSARPRIEHLGWVGTTLRHDDAWWGTHYPPNGWRCRCWVRPTTEAALGRMGKGGPDKAPEAPKGHPPSWGIDQGWDYNPGAAWQRGEVLPPKTGVTGEPGARPELPMPTEPLTPPPATMPPLRGARLPPAERVPAPPPAPVPVASAEELSSFLQAPSGEVVVERLMPELQAHLRAGVAEVRLSVPTIEKQRRHHPELLDEEYELARGVLRHPGLAVQDRPLHVQMFRHAGERLYCAVVKVTGALDRLYLVSFHRARENDINRALRRGELILGSAAEAVAPARASAEGR